MSRIPDDLVIWRRQQAANNQNPWSPVLRMLADDVQPAVLDTSYLTAEDLADADIAVNVQAIAATAEFISWAAEDEDDGLAFGYWRGPNDLPLAEAPIVCLDSEGQFRIIPGASLSEALNYQYAAYVEDGYAGLVRKCRALNVTITADDPADLNQSAISPTPADYHRDLCDRRHRNHT